MNKKALALLSGGLDSILAVKLMLEQGVEVEALNFSSVFCNCAGKDNENVAKKAAASLGVPFKSIDFTEEFLEILKNPRYGYGSNANPCIDCRIFMLKKAKEYMKETGASFMITGEVVGERPMSQRKDALLLIDKRADVKGMVLRPLSAKLLEPTLPETESVVDREKLLDISGRSRKPQIALAAKFGIIDYPNPAGGCLLTDPGFGKRVKDLLKHNALDVDNLTILTVGRHFRLSDTAKLIIGRDERENNILQSIALPEDIIFKLKDHQGPLSILRGSMDKAMIDMACGIIAYHTKFRDEGELKVNFWKAGDGNKVTISVKIADRQAFESLRIG